MVARVSTDGFPSKTGACTYPVASRRPHHQLGLLRAVSGFQGALAQWPDDQTAAPVQGAGPSASRRRQLADLVAEIEFRARTNDGRLRLARSRASGTPPMLAPCWSFDRGPLVVGTKGPTLL